MKRLLKFSTWIYGLCFALILFVALRLTFPFDEERIPGITVSWTVVFVLLLSLIANNFYTKYLRDIEVDRLRRDEIEVQLKKLAIIAENTSNSVLVCDPDGKIEWTNRAFTEMTGYTLEESIGKKPGEFLQGQESDPKVLAYMHAQLAAQKGFHVEVLNYSKIGKPFWVEINCEPIFNEENKLSQFIAIQSDVTERKHIEKVKATFVSNVSHELRTPVSSIKGTLEMLKEESLSEESQTLITIAHHSCDRLLNLVNDLLDSEKIASGKIELKVGPVSVTQLLNATLLENQSYATQFQSHLKIERSEEMMIEADYDRLLQVLTNFISNAVKFSPENSTIKISAQKAPGGIRFSVADQGVGIRPINREKVFERFTSVHTQTSNKVSGTGLGLSICKGIIQAHGGIIGCTDAPGGGALFFFEIPTQQKREDVS